MDANKARMFRKGLRAGPAARRAACCAAAIPGNSAAESVVVGGFSTFFGLYSNLITARILLSWFPGLQNQAWLRPLYTVCDPFLNSFRGVIPPIFGLDLSPIIAITLLQALGSASIALGAEESGRANQRRSGFHPRGIFQLPRMPRILTNGRRQQMQKA